MIRLDRLSYTNVCFFKTIYWPNKWILLFSNYVFSISGKARSKALNQCTIQWRGCSATQCWCKGSSICSKPSPRCKLCKNYQVHMDQVHLLYFVTGNTQCSHHPLSRWWVLLCPHQHYIWRWRHHRDRWEELQWTVQQHHLREYHIL